jgi:hypothetical protein
VDIPVADDAFEAPTDLRPTDVGDLHREWAGEPTTKPTDLWAVAALAAAFAIPADHPALRAPDVDAHFLWVFWFEEPLW